MPKRTEKFGSNDVWYVRREGRGESSVIHVHDKGGGGGVAFRVGQAEARALIDALSKVTLMPPTTVGPDSGDAMDT